MSENIIKIVLPVFEKNLNLTEDEREIYKILSRTTLKPISEITPYVEFGKSKTTQLLKEMGKKGVVKIEGRGSHIAAFPFIQALQPGQEKNTFLLTPVPLHVKPAPSTQEVKMRMIGQVGFSRM